MTTTIKCLICAETLQESYRPMMATHVEHADMPKHSQTPLPRTKDGCFGAMRKIPHTDIYVPDSNMAWPEYNSWQASLRAATTYLGYDSNLGIDVQTLSRKESNLVLRVALMIHLGQIQ